MRKIFFSVLAVFLFVSVKAQLSLGVNSTYHHAMDKSAELILVERGLQRYGVDYKGTDGYLSYGMAAYAENDRLYFMPAINYSEITNRLSAMDYVEGDYVMKDFTIKTQTVHLPITAGFKLGKARLGLGPNFMYVLDTQQNLSSFAGVTFDQRKLRTGFHFQLGYDPIPNIKLSMGYEVGFYKVSDDYRFAGKPVGLNSTPKALTFTVGVFL